MTLPTSSRTPSTAHGDGPRNRISHRNAIATTLPPTGTLLDAAVDHGVVLFSSHYDVAHGDVLVLLPSTPSRDCRSAAAAFATDPQKRLRSPAAAETPTAAPTPSGRPRKRTYASVLPPLLATPSTSSPPPWRCLSPHPRCLQSRERLSLTRLRSLPASLP